MSSYSERRMRSTAVMDEAKRRASQRLGTRQLSCLRAMCEHGGYPGMGWVYDNHSGTVRTLDSLVKRGIVETHQVPYRGVLASKLPESHPYAGRTYTSYRLAEWARDIMGGKAIQTNETKEVAAQ